MQSSLLHQLISFVESAGIREENPLAHVRTVKIKPRRPVCRIPFDMPAVSLGKVQGIVGADVIRRGIRLITGVIIRFGRRSCKPVITVERNSQGKFLRWHKFQRVVQIARRPRPSRHRSRAPSIAYADRKSSSKSNRQTAQAPSGHMPRASFHKSTRKIRLRRADLEHWVRSQS